MKRLAPVLLCCLALLAASCTSGTGSVAGSAAATVNGVEISEDDLFRQLDALVAVEGYGQVFQVQTAAGETPGTYDVTTAASVLNALVVFELARQELEDRDVVVDEAVRGEVEAQLTEAFTNLDADLVTQVATSLAAIDAVGQLYLDGDLDTEVTDEEVRAVFDEDPSAFAETCTRLIFVSADTDGPEAAAAEAEDILAELEGGAAFETLATERSDDASSADGGDLGCNPPNSLPPEIEDAMAEVEIGDPTSPVEIDAGAPSGGGFVIAQVYERNEPVYEDVEAELRAGLEQASQEEAQAVAQQAFAEWQADAVRSADVDVDPRFGTWTHLRVDPQTGAPVETDRADAEAAEIVPPEGPLVPAADAPLVPGQDLLGTTEE